MNMQLTPPGPKSPRICVVDDNPVVGIRVQKLLNARGFDDVTVYRSAEPALAACRLQLPDLLLVDYAMPFVNGLTFIEALRRNASARELPIAVFTGRAVEGLQQEAFAAGANLVLSKEITGTQLLGHVKRLLGHAPDAQARPPEAAPAGRYSRVADVAPVGAIGGGLGVPGAETGISIEDHHLLQCLGRVAALRDNRGTQHTNRMAMYAAAIGRRLGLSSSQGQMLRAAAPLHDLGNVSTPDTILQKPARLTTQETSLMQHHTWLGYELMCDSPSPLIRLGAEIALSHHERWNGSGYPRRLLAEAIPLSARIVAVADTLDALTIDRPYKQARSFEHALLQIKVGAGVEFDPSVVEALLDIDAELLDIKRHFNKAIPFANTAPMSPS